MEEERVKTEIGTIVVRNFGLASLEEIANRILSIKGIRIESDDQSLPRVGSILPSTRQDEQRKMLDAGFVKCIKRREHGS